MAAQDAFAQADANERTAFFWRQGALFTQGKLYKHRDSIQQQWAHYEMVDTFQHGGVVEHDAQHFLEWGVYFSRGTHNSRDTTKPMLKSMIAWKKVAGNWKKELEVIYPVTVAIPEGLDSLAAARNQWLQLANAHQPAQLVADIYQPNAIYLNDGYAYTDRAAIAEKYAYMTSEKWSIALKSWFQSVVQADIYYDLGRYYTQGQGHYCFVWQRTAADNWQLILDFNF